MASKLALFVTLSLLSAVAVHGCEPYCQTPVVVPPAYNGGGKCSIDVLNLRVCANVLGGLLGLKVNVPAHDECCPLLRGWSTSTPPSASAPPSRPTSSALSISTCLWT
ncbi:hypothetical protein ACQ4PT_018371 [Festuca glaucescens]